MISKMRNYGMFQEVFSIIDGSTDEYTVEWGNIPTNGQFTPYNKTITLSKEIYENSGAFVMSISEELYHVYQRIVKSPEEQVNIEYEAKIFAMIESIFMGVPYSYECDGLKQFHEELNGKYIDESYTKILYNDSLPTIYIHYGEEFLDNEKKSRVPDYKVPISSMPNRLKELLLNNSKRKK